jgi:hypothetical protein
MSKNSLLALTGVGLAIAGAIWMTLGTRSAAPSAQARSNASATTAARTAAASAASQTQDASAPAASAAAQSAPSVSEGAATGSAATASVQTASKQPTTGSAPAATVAAPGVAGQQAYVDPATGKLRPAEHDDAAALNAKASGVRRLARTAQAAEPQEFPTEGGAMGIAVPDEVLPYTVATKTPDGRVVIEHVTGGKTAVKKVKENTKNGGMVQRKGESNDR